MTSQTVRQPMTHFERTLPGMCASNSTLAGQIASIGYTYGPLWRRRPCRPACSLRVIDQPTGICSEQKSTRVFYSPTSCTTSPPGTAALPTQALRLQR